MVSRKLWGEPIYLPETLLALWPELAGARFRCGGLPTRIGGWFLGTREVAGIALGGTVWLARRDYVHDVPLLLHEVRHVQQSSSIPFFAWRYVWQCLRHGYHRNAFEVDARDYAARRTSSVQGGSRA